MDLQNVLEIAEMIEGLPDDDFNLLKTELKKRGILDKLKNDGWGIH